MFVYKITNTKNNKVYIGQSINSIEKRFQRHINDAVNNKLQTHFARAIRKHGKESFVVELIDTANTQEELNLKEQYWIRFYNSIDPEHGYNETDAINKCGGNTYMSKTKEEMAAIKKKLSDSKTGSNNPKATIVKCLNTETNKELVFDCVEDCRKYFNEATHRFITTRCLGITKSLYRSIWAIAYFENDYVYEPEVHKRGTVINVVDPEGNETEFKSIRQMCRELGFNRGNIQKIISNGVKKFVYGNSQIFVLN